MIFAFGMALQGSDKVFDFLDTVFSEVTQLFPFEYVHIGGDECPKVRWESCPRCQARMRECNLSNECELQSWFIKRISQKLAAKGRKIIGRSTRNEW